MTVMPIVENPSVVFNMGATNDWEVGLVITPSWIASNSPQIARFSSSGAANITFPSGMTSFPGAVVVAGGATITMTVQWVFNRPVYNSNGANRVQIYGPRGYFIGLQG
jgi:non-ribosomal peptide synthetase component F